MWRWLLGALISALLLLALYLLRGRTATTPDKRRIRRVLFSLQPRWSDSRLTHIALIQALRTNASPSILHSDRGSEYMSERHAMTCTRFGIQLSASKPGKPWQNGFMERCIKSIKEELGPLAQYGTIDELYVGVANAISYYNTSRIHTALGMPPKAYAETLARPPKFREMVFGKKGA
jgi:transposase InsO family protein